MQSSRCSIIPIFALGILLAAGAVAQQQSSERLLLSNSIIGTDIRNAQGEKLGSIGQLIMDPASGQAKYVIVDIGGIFGFREREIAIPWELLTVVQKGTITANATQEDFKRAPVFDESAWESTLDRSEWEREIRDYFGNLTSE